jgi:hypothetical protein
MLNELSLAVEERVRKLRAAATISKDTSADISKVLVEIQRNLSNTLKAFNAQAQQRNDLVERMTKRLSIGENLQYEKFSFTISRR